MGKQYLSDGVYAEYDEYGIILTTEDGVSVRNKIYLEPKVFSALIKMYGWVVSVEENK